MQRYREHGLSVVQPLLPAIMAAVTNYKPYLPYRTETTVSFEHGEYRRNDGALRKADKMDNARYTWMPGVRLW